MDFRHQIAAPAGLADIDVDALVLVIGERRRSARSPRRWRTLIANAVSEGDLALKKGKHALSASAGRRRARARVVVGVAGDASPKSFKAAVAQRPRRAQVERRQDASASPRRRRGAQRRPRRGGGASPPPTPPIVYTPHQAERAAGAGRRRRSRCSAQAQRSQGRCSRACARAQAIAAGVTLAREFGNRPGNDCTPTWLGQQAKKLGKQFDLEVEVLDRKEIEKLGMGSFLAVAQGSDEPPRFIVARYDGAAEDAGAGRPGRQGHHLRHRRHLAQAGRRDGRDEVRHVRRGERARHAARGRRAEGRRSTWSCIVPTCDNMPSGTRRQAGRRRHQHVGPDDRDPQHRRRRPPDPVRRADLRRALQAGGRGRRRDADRRLRDRARPSPLGPVQRRRRGRRADARRQPGARSTRAGACRSTRSTTRR